MSTMGRCAAAALVAASIVVGGCGKSGDPPPTILNTEKVERAIEQTIAAQRGRNARVSCPSGVQQKKGLDFACTAVIKRQSTRFVVSQNDDGGHVHYEAP